MDKWECTVCGYIYDPQQGDPKRNISPQTPFEQLPENWTCPVCGAPKSLFARKQPKPV
ncbi:MAG: rubredoxin [Candidatus Bathyarchaeota archaeon]|nr:rubredoxin [Candidatus Bathyarchaeota archaeon]